MQAPVLSKQNTALPYNRLQLTWGEGSGRPGVLMTWRCQAHKKDALPRNKSYQGGWSCRGGPHWGSGATSSTNTQRNPPLFFFSSKLFYMITEMPLAPHESDGQKANEEESKSPTVPPILNQHHQLLCFLPDSRSLSNASYFQLQV